MATSYDIGIPSVTQERAEFCRIGVGDARVYNRAMPEGKLRQPSDPLYQAMREGRAEDFNRQRVAAGLHDLHACDFRGADLRGFNCVDLDLTDCYFRHADLRGLDLRSCSLEGASLHGAHISGVYFPAALDPAEIDMSVRLGTRMRYRR
jgi:uncharacterized protein YjbI with pentapeptide repeats